MGINREERILSFHDEVFAVPVPVPVPENLESEHARSMAVEVADQSCQYLQSFSSSHCCRLPSHSDNECYLAVPLLHTLRDLMQTTPSICSR